MFYWKRVLAPVLMVIGSPAVAQTYTDRATFITDAGALTTIDFDNYIADQSFSTTPVSLPGVTIAEIGSTHSQYNTIDAAPFNFATSVNGTSDLSMETFRGSGGASTSITLTFSNPITAFGADFFGMNNLTARTEIVAGGQTFTPPILPTRENSFFGFISSTPFTSVTFQTSSGIATNDTIALDNLSFAAAAPEPTTWAMMIGGFGVVGGALRRRRKPVLLPA